MEQRDRDKIALYCDRIVLKIDMTKLFPKLLEHRIYNPDDVNIPRWKVSFTCALFIYYIMNYVYIVSK